MPFVLAVATRPIERRGTAFAAQGPSPREPQQALQNHKET